jgi:hypothetical protein
MAVTELLPGFAPKGSLIFAAQGLPSIQTAKTRRSTTKAQLHEISGLQIYWFDPETCWLSLDSFVPRWFFP